MNNQLLIPPSETLPFNGLRALVPQDFADVQRFAKMFIESPFCPDSMRNIAACSAAIMMGMEVGLTPMMAMQSIAVINGKPSIWGDGLLALIMASAEFEDIDEKIEGKGEQMVASCMVMRVGKKRAVVRTFSVEDAKLAGLWSKAGPWKSYPQRMLQMRARSWAIRDAFPDVLRGLSSAEEQADVVAVSPEQQAPPPPTAEPLVVAKPEAPSDQPPAKPASEGAEAADEFAEGIFTYDDAKALDEALAELTTTDEIFAMLSAMTKDKVMSPSDEGIVETIADRHLDRVTKSVDEPEPPAED
jgi:hypothetical protein